MKTMMTLTAAALLWGGVAFADAFSDNIATAYAQAGYANVSVKIENGQYIVVADKDGMTYSFVVDAKTGISTPYKDGMKSDGDHDTEGAGDDDGGVVKGGIPGFKSTGSSGEDGEDDEGNEGGEGSESGESGN